MWIIKELIRGLLLTLRYLFSRAVTIQYPKKKRALALYFRGKPRLDKEKCVICGICKSICPAEIIEIEASKNELGEEVAKPLEVAKPRKVLKKFTIDLSRCAFCGLCSESCPQGALQLTKEYELATLDKKELLLRW